VPLVDLEDDSGAAVSHSAIPGIQRISTAQLARLPADELTKEMLKD
jgi:hypothetical protein